MPRMNSYHKLEWIYSAIQEAQKGNLDPLPKALELVEAVRRRYFHVAKQTRTFGALNAADLVIALIDLRKSSGEGTLGINDQVAEIIDHETRSPRILTTMKQIARSAKYDQADGMKELEARLESIGNDANAAVDNLEPA